MPYTLLAETSGVATFGRERRHRDVVVVVIDVIDVIDWMLNIILIFRPLAKFLVYWLNFITWHCNLKLNYDLRKRSLKSLPLPVGSRVENTAAFLSLRSSMLYKNCQLGFASHKKENYDSS